MDENTNFNQSEKKPKNKKIITAVIFFIIILALVYGGGGEVVKWWKEKQELVKMGFVHDKFPFTPLTEEELVRKGLWSGESQWYDSIPTRTTPEETYAIFRQALIDGDIDKAVGCFVEKKRSEWKDGLKRVLADQNLKNEMLNDLPVKLEDTYVETEEVINKKMEDINLNKISVFDYEYSVLKNGKKWAHAVIFQKDFDGDWKIESL